MGQCKSEQEGPTSSRSGPSRAAAFSNSAEARGKSARQTLRPSITPSDNIALRRHEFQGLVQLLRARTRSRWTAATGSRSAMARLSRRQPK